MSETPQEPPATMAAQIEAEKIRLLRAQLSTVLLAVVLVSSGLAVIFYGVVDGRLLGPWLGAQYALSLWRWWLAGRFDRQAGALDEAALRRWGWRFALTSGLSGLLWGSAAFLFLLPQEPLYLTSLTIIILGMAAGSMPSLSAYPPAYVFYVVPSLSCMSLALATMGGAGYLLALLTLVFLAASLVFAGNIHRTLVESLRLRFENLELVGELRRQKAIAESANQAKSRFLAAASHDLRQPLHALGLFVDALKSAGDEAARGRLLERVDDALEALGKLFDALLDISRLDAGVVEARREHFPLAPLLRKLEGEFRAVAEARGLRLGVLSTTLAVESDPLLLERILRNLLANALRYTERGGVVLGARRRGGAVCIEVWDSGCGIDAEGLGRIFDEFAQLQNPERDRSKGLGLGLAIVRRLCALLGHDIAVQSRPGRGSVFRVRVPRGQAGDGGAPRFAAPPEVLALQGLRVLVIDDESAILEAMGALLTAWGCEVWLAESAEAAVAQLADGPAPAVILADLRLRGGRTGIEAITALRGHYGEEIPALLLSGDTAPERLQLAREAGLPMLHKPVKPARLRAFLQRCR